MSTITVQLQVADALAAELAALAAQLADDPPRCRAASGSLRTALAGDVGDRAGAAAERWAVLAGLLADRCATTARTLGAAVEAYRQADAVLARGLLAAGGRAR